MRLSASTTTAVEHAPVGAPGSPPTAWQVPVLYDRLGQALRLADAAMTAGDGLVKSVQLERASSVVYQLLGAVNFQDGGELAPRLAALYGFFASELLAVGRSGERAALTRLIDMADVLSGSWRDDESTLSQNSQPLLVI